jgi:hypothetical protein
MNKIPSIYLLALDPTANKTETNRVEIETRNGQGLKRIIERSTRARTK